jgi:hypothetical protein
MSEEKHAVPIVIKKAAVAKVGLPVTLMKF